MTYTSEARAANARKGAQMRPGAAARAVAMAAGLRTSAAQARWEEIALGEVAPVIELTRELIGAHVG